jgi:phage protein D
VGDAGTASAFYAVRPTVEVGGRAEAGLAADLVSLLVEETTEGLYRCEATFANWGPRGTDADFLYFDRDVLDFGSAFAVSAGSGEAAGRLFEGRIYGLEARYPVDAPPEITVLAEDRFQDLRMTRRTRTFEDVSDRDVFEQIAGDHDLERSLDLPGPTHRVLAQLNQSDLAFLRERARAVGAEVWIEGRTLHAGPRPGRGGEAVTLSLGQGLQAFSVLADLANQRTAVTVGGWDVETKEGIAAEATETAVRSELNGSRSGAALLGQAFGARAERVVHMVPFSEEEARAVAESHFRATARRFVTGRGEAEGDARLRVGATVELRGLGPLFEGRYTLTEVRHTIGGDGFRTSFTVERPGVNAP